MKFCFSQCVLPGAFSSPAGVCILRMISRTAPEYASQLYLPEPLLFFPARKINGRFGLQVGGLWPCHHGCIMFCSVGDQRFGDYLLSSGELRVVNDPKPFSMDFPLKARSCIRQLVEGLVAYPDKFVGNRCLLYSVKKRFIHWSRISDFVGCGFMSWRHWTARTNRLSFIHVLAKCRDQ